jgi:2-keto-4-pentenoate hydratase/2-oxohepta-3-ene-1,7-dioic acid hydratase in catechol pathway
MTRLTRFATTDGPRYGIVREDGIICELVGDDPFADTLEMGAEMGPYETLLLVPPIRPSKIVCVGRNYAAHAAEHQAEVPEEPMIFLKPPSALIGYDLPIQLPDNVGRVDLEAELAVVIGKVGRNIPKDKALEYVLGYTCGNDVSARVLQQKDKQYGRAKGFDTFCPLGPWIETDIGDPSNLGVMGRLNGKTVIDGNTAQMVFDVPTLIEFISGVMTLLPGDVILTGTPEGVSELSVGDVVEIEVEGIGTLRNSVEGAMP